MLKAFVGIASDQGLAVLHPEGEETLSLIHRFTQAETGRVGFWAVLGDTDARRVQVTLLAGHAREAMWVLDRSAKDMGRIVPTTPRPPLH